MAISIRKQYEKADRLKSHAVDAVYAAALPRQDVRFWDCYAMASPEVRAAYNYAQAECDRIRREAIDKGRAYPGAYSLLCWN